MAIAIKTPEEIENIRTSSKILGKVVDETLKEAKPGVSTKKLDAIAEQLIREKGGLPAFKGYKGYPATICAARNEVVVHGIPSESDILQEGDIFTIDCGVIYKGMYSDHARSIGIGEISSEKNRLLKAADEALAIGIKAATPGTEVNQIGKAIQSVIEKYGFYVIHDLTGHGIGHTLHEPPLVLNYFENQPSVKLEPGMTIAIEPIFSTSTHDIYTHTDGWTISTKDKSNSVQAEHTILITKTGNEILTKV